MAITLTGTGGLFTRLGRLAGLLNALNAFRGTADLSGASIVSIGTGFDNIQAQFLANNPQLVDNLFSSRDTYRGNHTQLTSYLVSLAKSTLIKMADDDTKLTTQNLANALTLLIGQMVANSNTITRPTVSAGSATAGRVDGTSNNGTGVLVASIKNPFGVQLDNVFAETLTAVCTQDTQSGASTNREQFTVSSPIAATDVLSWDFPKGSNSTKLLTAVDPTQDNAGGNLLTKSDFEVFTTANIPDNFAVLSGTPGTDILDGTGGSGYFGSKSLRFFYNSGSTPAIAQTFNLAGGTLGTLSPNTVYAVNFFAKRDSGLTGTGTLALSLVDGSNTVINDDAGTANTVTKVMSTLTTSYAAVNGFFRTPAVMPSVYKLKVYVSVAIADSGKGINVDGLALTPATDMYTGGPKLALFAGSTKFVKTDRFLVVIANDYAGKFALSLDKFFGLRASGFQIPSAASGSISDSLVA